MEVDVLLEIVEEVTTMANLAAFITEVVLEVMVEVELKVIAEVAPEVMVELAPEAMALLEAFVVQETAVEVATLPKVLDSALVLEVVSEEVVLVRQANLVDAQLEFVEVVVLGVMEGLVGMEVKEVQVVG